MLCSFHRFSSTPRVKRESIVIPQAPSACRDLLAVRCRDSKASFDVGMRGARQSRPSNDEPRHSPRDTHEGFSMSKLRVHIFSISLDGYGAGPDQSVKEPLGRNGESLHDWVVPTRTFKGPRAKSPGTIGVDDAVTAQGMGNLGAWILGRNMFGPVRGPWPDESWKGWW